MVLALVLTVVASALCAGLAPRGWRHRLHHLLPAPAMALGMGHLGLSAGLLPAVLAAGVLWASAVHLARRARRGQAVLAADAVDCAAMALALVVAALHSAARGAAGTAAQAAATTTGHHGAHLLLHPAGGALGDELLPAALLLALGVLASRVLLGGGSAGDGEPAQGGWRSSTGVRVGAGALMATATALMLVA